MKSNQPIKPVSGKRNRQKGHDAERLYANQFKKLGYPYCVTSRRGSRLHDDAGIDLIYVPFNVQIKAGKQQGINYSKELSYIATRIKELFPPISPEHTLPTILIHEKPCTQGRKRTPQDSLVIMSFEDFKSLIATKEQTKQTEQTK